MMSASAHKNEMGIAAYADGQKGPRIYIFPPDPISADPTTPPHARLAADAQQQEGFGHPLRVSLALLARKTPPFTTTHV